MCERVASHERPQRKVQATHLLAEMASEFHSSCSIRALPGTILPQESNTGGQAQGLVLTGHRACSHQDTQTLHRGLGSLGGTEAFYYSLNVLLWVHFCLCGNEGKQKSFQAGIFKRKPRCWVFQRKEVQQVA